MTTEIEKTERPRIERHKVAINFPKDLYEKIAARAAKEDKSFSDQAIDLCKCGELCLSESDAYEPMGYPRQPLGQGGVILDMPPSKPDKV